MTMQQILYALTIAQCGSMNRAAQKMYVTQPSLTSTIQDLEEELNIKIFNRTAKGVIVTAEGEDFLARARHLYQQYEMLIENYSDAGKIKRKFGVSTQHYSFVVKAFVNTVKKFDTSEFEFAILETRTRDVIYDVANAKSEVGVLFINDYNKKIIDRMLNKHDLEFNELISCNAFVYMWKGNPLADKEKVNLKQLADYPCLYFDQGDESSLFFAEEILSDYEYARSIKTNDRATMLNLMMGLNAYTLCSGIIASDINGDDFVAVPFEEDKENKNGSMRVGYITNKKTTLSEVGEMFVKELKHCLNI